MNSVSILPDLSLFEQFLFQVLDVILNLGSDLARVLGSFFLIHQLILQLMSSLIHQSLLLQQLLMRVLYKNVMK